MNLWKRISRRDHQVAVWKQSIEHIQRKFCKEFNISLADMNSPCRNSEFVLPRHLAMWASKKLTFASFPVIGLIFSGRDHSTIIHGFKHAEEMMTKDPSLKARVETVLKAWGNGN